MKRTFVLFSAAVVAAISIAAAPARAEPEPGPGAAIWVSLPSIDGATGGELGVERFEAPSHVSVVGTLGFRKTASGDYSGYAGGAGLEARWYWRGRAIWTPLPAGSMVGPFLGGRLDASLSHTRDLADDRSLGTTLVLGWAAIAGYRIAPWRNLSLTPSIGLGLRNEHDLRGRLPPWTQGTITIGLELGWMF